MNLEVPCIVQVYYERTKQIQWELSGHILEELWIERQICYETDPSVYNQRAGSVY